MFYYCLGLYHYEYEWEDGMTTTDPDLLKLEALFNERLSGDYDCTTCGLRDCICDEGTMESMERDREGL